jgi:hypothetical protein
VTTPPKQEGASHAGAQTVVNGLCVAFACADEQRSCMHIAASAGQLGVVELLLQYHAAVNRKDAHGKTPLMNAVAKDHSAVISKLLEAKATLDMDEADAASALCDKAREARFVAIQTLLKSGVNVNSADCARGRYGKSSNHATLPFTARTQTKLEWAFIALAPCPHPIVSTDLVSYACTDDKRTALHLAASEGNKRMVQYLLDNGAHANCQDRWKGTPLGDALREGHMTVAAYLISKGGKLGWDEARTSAELCELARKVPHLEGRAPADTLCLTNHAGCHGRGRVILMACRCIFEPAATSMLLIVSEVARTRNTPFACRSLRDVLLFGVACAQTTSGRASIWRHLRATWPSCKACSLCPVSM